MHIQTNRLTLQPVRVDSLEDLARLLTDPIVGKTYMVPDFANEAAAYTLADRIRELSQNPEKFVLGIYLGNRLIGLMNETDISGDSIEVGYAIRSDLHGCGFATEALAAGIAYLFTAGYNQVKAGAFEDNTASIRVMEKCAMTRLPQTDEIAYRGQIHRCVYYGIGREHSESLQTQ
jgi:RimJ/RimL family protein N-acetyltransferase